jgi:hypothetical protein
MRRAPADHHRGQSFGAFRLMASVERLSAVSTGDDRPGALSTGDADRPSGRGYLAAGSRRLRIFWRTSGLACAIRRIEVYSSTESP